MNKKNLFTFLLVTVFLILSTFSVYANNFTDSFFDGEKQEIKDLLDAETTDNLEELGIDDFSIDELADISLKSAVRVIFGLFTTSLTEISEFLGICIGLIILVSCGNSLMSNSSGTSRMFSVVAVCVISLISYTYIDSLISGTVSVIVTICSLMKLLVPALCSVITIIGKPSLAVSSSAISLYVSEITVAICNDFLAPLMCIFCAFGICGSMYSSFDISSILMLIKKIFSMILGLLGTIYSGVLSVKDAVSVGIDKVAIKGIQFILGSAVPIVGGTLSEGLSAGISALSLFKTTFGLTGIVVAIVIMLPVFIQLIVWIATLYICEYISKAFCIDKCSAIFESLRYVVTMLLTMLIFIIFIFLISISTLLILSKGA